MLRVLTLSTLFPNPAEPTLGISVARQTVGLAALEEVEVEVVAPIGLPPWPLSLLPRHAARARLPRKTRHEGLTVHHPRFTTTGIDRPRTARTMARKLLPLLRAIRRRFPFDVIDAESFWPDGPAAMALARALGVPFSVKARGSDIQYWGSRAGIRRQLVAAARAADGVLAVSEALKRAMVAGGMPEDRIRVHYPGVDAALFAPIDRARAKEQLAVEGPLIVSAGSLTPYKGHCLALDAIRMIDGANLIVIGDGPQRGTLERRARALGLQGRVRFLGARPHGEMPFYFGAADVMLLPSSAEGLASVWIEALACGTPIVITDVGGAREVVDGPDSGRLIHFDAHAAASAIRELLAAPPEPHSVRRVAERFSWERNSRELFDHLSGLV